MSAAKSEPTQYSVYLMLPEAATRALDAWATDAAGASIPAAGWHMTLLPAFASKADEAKLMALIEEVALRHAPFAVHLSHVELVADHTRAGYAALFLTDGHSQTQHSQAQHSQAQHSALYALQADLAENLATIRIGTQSTLDDASFRPHVTLALAVSEKEGERLATSARRAALQVSMDVGAMWVMRKAAMAMGQIALWQRRFALSKAQGVKR
ncbi:MAG: 2'-5' RNA ligase family protein [Caldilinea sp.]